MIYADSSEHPGLLRRLFLLSPEDMDLNRYPKGASMKGLLGPNRCSSSLFCNPESSLSWFLDSCVHMDCSSAHPRKALPKASKRRLAVRDCGKQPCVVMNFTILSSASGFREGSSRSGPNNYANYHSDVYNLRYMILYPNQNLRPSCWYLLGPHRAVAA